MRMRNKPWAEEAIRDHPHLVLPHPQEWRGKWSRFFGRDIPIHLEIGTGKGRFITEMARLHPNIGFVGLELQTSVVGVALKKVKKIHEEDGVSNVCLIRGNARDITEFFAKGEVERIYLNFSDPWPKNRHAKRRLTYPAFLEKFQYILTNQGDIHLKTDNEGFFEYSLNSLADFGCRLQNITFDLHRKLRLAGQEEQNVFTEYEQKFAAQGMKIYRCEAIMPNKEG